jgi:hypothetical protein
LATQQELTQWLQEGILAAKAGRIDQARFRLLDVVEQDHTNEAAWYWLYTVFDRQADRRVCLENLLTINPGNQWARKELQNYLTPAHAQPAKNRPSAKAKPGAPKPKAASKKRAKSAAARPPRPVTLKLVTAFWFGLSAMLVGGGIVAFFQWLAAGLRTRSFPVYLTAFQALELLAATLFVIAGLVGLVIASLLLVRSMAGFYGSIVLALGLLLIGPTVSLITIPPNYASLICTGGIAGMIMLLTLASQPGFEPVDMAGESQ